MTQMIKDAIQLVGELNAEFDEKIQQQPFYLETDGITHYKIIFLGDSVCSDEEYDGNTFDDQDEPMRDYVLRNAERTIAELAQYWWPTQGDHETAAEALTRVSEPIPSGMLKFSITLDAESLVQMFKVLIDAKYLDKEEFRAAWVDACRRVGFSDEKLREAGLEVPERAK